MCPSVENKCLGVLVLAKLFAKQFDYCRFAAAPRTRERDGTTAFLFPDQICDRQCNLFVFEIVLVGNSIDDEMSRTGIIRCGFARHS